MPDRGLRHQRRRGIHLINQNPGLADLQRRLPVIRRARAAGEVLREKINSAIGIGEDFQMQMVKAWLRQRLRTH